MQFLRVISQQLSRFTALVIILAAAVTFIEPATFSWVTGDAQVIVLGVIMLAMGMTLGKEDYKVLAQRRAFPKLCVTAYNPLTGE